jgi:hypothetical protein
MTSLMTQGDAVAIDTRPIRPASVSVNKTGWMRISRGLSCTVLLVTLAACAGSVAPPTTVTDLSQDQRASLHLSDITGEVGPGVAMTPDDVNRIVQQVAAEIRAASPNVLLTAGDPEAVQTKLMKMTFTRYDDGSAFARFMLAGLGQIYIEGNVVLLDTQTGQVLGQYKVSKDFSFGGIYGGITNIRDVEKGFARSVAEIVKPKT